MGSSAMERGKVRQGTEDSGDQGEMKFHRGWRGEASLRSLCANKQDNNNENYSFGFEIQSVLALKKIYIYIFISFLYAPFQFTVS